MYKRTFMVVMALLTALSLLAACGGSGGGAATTAAATAAAATTATTAAPAATTAAAGGETTAATTTAAAATTAAASDGEAAATTAAATGDAAVSSILYFEEPVTIDIWMDENPTYLYKKGSLIESTLNERSNLFFNVTPFQTGIEERINLGLASGDLPDAYFNINLSRASNWGTRQGALVDISQFFDQMPNYTAWAESMGDYTDYFYTSDGKLFIAPNYGYGLASNSTFWIYRKDLLEKHGLAIPTTEVELYEVCKALKAEYPDVYPFANRGWVPDLGILGRIAYQWGSGFNMYYSNEMGSWTYAQLEPAFRDCIEFMAKMYAEELMPPNSLSLDNPSWEELVSTGKGIIFNDYQSRIDLFTIEVSKIDPEAKFAYMPPFKGGANGTDKFNSQTQLRTDGYGIFATSDNIPEIIRFFDWFYTDEAKELLSWGVEGKSFTRNADGTKEFIGMTPGQSTFFDLVNTYGLFQRGFYCLVDPPSHTTSLASEETLYAVSRLSTDSGAYRIPGIAFNETRQDRVTVLQTAINTASAEALGQFITGQRPMSEWDAFVEQLNTMGVQELITIYNEQQAENEAVMGGKVTLGGAINS